jgi:hypothetical protein
MRITPERVTQIVAMDDQPVLRNLLITNGYHWLTLAMAELLGEDSAWPIFGVWASKQAGVFIRGDELPLRLREHLDANPHVGPYEAARAILNGMSTFLAGGNTIVFEEIGAGFASFVQTFADPDARTDDRLAAFVAQFSEGPSEPDVVEMRDDGTLARRRSGGQSLLREAMGYYFAALHERDPTHRAQLVLLGNVIVGLHEQIRLQPYIAGAFESPAETFLRLARVDAHTFTDLVAFVRRIGTEVFMTLRTPNEVLRMGEDLPAPPDGELWPEPLVRLEHPRLLEITEQLGTYDTRERKLVLADRVEGWLLSTLSRISLARPEAQGSAARDWSSLPDRMRYIFEMFRSRQRDISLRTPPFTPQQQAELAQGRRAGRPPRDPRDPDRSASPRQ